MARQAAAITPRLPSFHKALLGFVALGLTMVVVSITLAATYASASAPATPQPIVVTGPSAATLPPPALTSYISSEPLPPAAKIVPSQSNAVFQPANGFSLASLPHRDYPTNLDDLSPLPHTIQDLLPVWASEPPPAKDYPTNTEGLPPLIPATQSLIDAYYPRVPAPLASHMRDALARTLAAESFVAQGNLLTNSGGALAGVLFTHAAGAPGEVYVHTVRLGNAIDGTSVVDSSAGCTNLEVWTASTTHYARCNDLLAAAAGMVVTPSQLETLPVAFLESMLFQCQAVSLLPSDATKIIPSDGYLCSGDDPENIGSYDLTLWVGQDSGYVSALDLRNHTASGEELALQVTFGRFGEGSAVIPGY